MALEVTFRHGEPRMIDYTPGSGNVASGEVVMLGNTTAPACGVAHHAITNSTKGSLAIGGGVYEAVNLNNSADYALVYWDQATNKVTSVSTNNAQFGFIVRDGAGGANSNALVFHWPVP